MDFDGYQVSPVSEHPEVSLLFWRGNPTVRHNKGRLLLMLASDSARMSDPALALNLALNPLPNPNLNLSIGDIEKLLPPRQSRLMGHQQSF